ncbi:nucleoside diphosphate kinase, putative [Pediculus humanus corporis]|uniref:Nucleoside diphosphate kinase homolog 5 n=1 Tax=Pediculus humanus subsp. corporis TaxID=121224 RepID=E0VSY8_PEDHC|nr:nucleoside diphosphate kinase, putative [Pediculus humanus corporis]EEB16494.1 nucleoside diphosphate kinase, putative [Pediculus humanus corporis]
MDINSSSGDTIRKEYERGEDSYLTPQPPTPDTYVTNTLSCPTLDQEVLYGDFDIETKFKCLPQLTLAIIKPDGMKYVKEIEKKIKDAGFDVVQSRLLQLSPEQVSDFYYEHYGQPYFPILVSTMCEGPVRVYVLRKKDAVETWKLMCGPTQVEEAKKIWPESLRAIYGTPDKSYKNVCHASDNCQKAKEEIKFFFPSLILDVNLEDEDDVTNYMNEYVNPILLEGLIQVCKNKPLDPIIWLATWLLMNNPNKPKMKEEIALTFT